MSIFVFLFCVSTFAHVMAHEEQIVITKESIVVFDNVTSQVPDDELIKPPTSTRHPREYDQRPSVMYEFMSAFDDDDDDDDKTGPTQVPKDRLTEVLDHLWDPTDSISTLFLLLISPSGASCEHKKRVLDVTAKEYTKLVVSAHQMRKWIVEVYGRLHGLDANIDYALDSCTENAYQRVDGSPIDY